MKLLLCLTWIAFLSSCVRSKPVIVEAPAGQDSVTVSLVVAAGTDLSKIDLSTVPIRTTPAPINIYSIDIDSLKSQNKRQDSVLLTLGRSVVLSTAQLTDSVKSLSTKLLQMSKGYNDLVLKIASVRDISASAFSTATDAMTEAVKKDTITSEQGKTVFKRLSDNTVVFTINDTLYKQITGYNIRLKALELTRQPTQ